MSAATRPTWRVRLQIGLWRHGGWAEWLLAVLLVVAGLQAWMLPQAGSELVATQRALALHESGRAVPMVEDKPAAESAQVIGLQATLEASLSPDAVVRRMAQLSQAEGITWAQGEYRSQWHTHTRTTQWQVMQPVQATYPQLRRFIDAVLRAHPNVSLDQVALQRDDATQSLIEVRLRWSIWTLGSAAHPRVSAGPGG